MSRHCQLQIKMPAAARGHSYCKHHIQVWLLENDSCPICRVRVLHYKEPFLKTQIKINWSFQIAELMVHMFVIWQDREQKSRRRGVDAGAKRKDLADNNHQDGHDDGCR